MARVLSVLAAGMAVPIEKNDLITLARVVALRKR